MVSRALSLLVILPSFAFALLFIGTDGFAPSEPGGCGIATVGGMAIWILTGTAAVCVPGLLATVRFIAGKPTRDLERVAELALAGHALLVGLATLCGLFG